LYDQEGSSNNLIFIENDGRIGAIYEKIHPFSYSKEDKVYKGGDKICIHDFMGVKIGLTICYDLRFPELYSILGKDSDVIVNIANWPDRRVGHWKTLLQARAVENQCFCIGVNRTGLDGKGLKYIESSVVFNANGDLPAFEKIDDKVKIFNIDKQWTESFKMKFNTTQDKRMDLYSVFYK